MPRPALELLSAIALCLFLAGNARAGGRPYAFVQGTQAVADGNVELENWFGAEVFPGASGDWEWWVGPVAGMSDHLEVGGFAILDQPTRIPGPAQSGLLLDSFRIQATLQPVQRGAWPVDLRIRGELGIPVAGEDVTRTWLSLIAGRELDRLDVTANLGGWVEWAQTGSGGVKGSYYPEAALGLSWAVARGLRLGGELYGWRSFNNPTDGQYIAGPALGYGRGRLWLSAAMGYGLEPGSPLHRGRVVVGLVL